MFDFSDLNHRLQELSFQIFSNLCLSHDILIKDGDLKIILKLIKNNSYCVLNDDYSEILICEISEETNKDVSDAFRPMVENKYIIKELINRVEK